MATPESLGWGVYTTDEATARAACETISHGGRSFVVNRRVAHLFLGFLKELTATGYRYDTGTLDDWSFAFRKIRGSETATSMHAGFAIDIDALKNQLGSTQTSFPDGIGAMAARWGLQWGGRWTRPDPMHFEVALTPAQVASFQTPTPQEEEPLQLDDDDQKWIVARLMESERRTARYVDHGSIDTPGSDDHHEAIRGDIAKLAAGLATLTELVKGLALGKLSGDVEVSGVLHIEDKPG